MVGKKRILFVCLGNIVRSPLAEHMFAYMAEQKGLSEKYEVDSAGTAAYHVGQSPDERMRQVAAEHGLKYDGRGRQFEPGDFDAFDVIIAMDDSNIDNILRLARDDEDEAKVHMMRKFDSQSQPEQSVPDPYYGGKDGFEHVYQIVERASKGLLEALEVGDLDG